MGAFIARQPNGLLCRFSTVVDTITDYNMTEKDYIKMYVERAREEAKDIIENYLRPFEEVKERFVDNNMTQEEFNKILLEMECVSGSGQGVPPVHL